MSQVVRHEVIEGVATLTIDRPDQRNALDGEVMRALFEAFDELEEDGGVRVLALRGAGDRAFCAGGDLEGMVRSGADRWRRRQLGHQYARLLDRLVSFPRPTVALVNGHALAGGLGLVLACDLAVAVEDATFGLPEIDVGVFPMVASALLVRSVPRKKAREMLFLGGRLTATEAAELGLVNLVLPRSEFEDGANRFVSRLAGKPGRVMALGKEALTAIDAPPGSELTLLAEMLGTVLDTEDFRRGVVAFFERRTPAWTHR